MDIKRNIEIFQKIESGKTYSEVAKEYGLSTERIRQIYCRQGGNSQLIRERKKEGSATKRKKKYQSILEIVNKHVQTIGYIPSNIELLNFLLTIGGSHYLSNIKKELLITIKLPRQIEISRNVKREKMLQDLKRIYTIIQRPVSRRDLITFGVKRYETYFRVFGSYKKACMHTGIPCPPKGGHRNKVL
jgi:hypothetical protein